VKAKRVINNVAAGKRKQFNRSSGYLETIIRYTKQIEWKNLLIIVAMGPSWPL